MTKHSLELFIGFVIAALLSIAPVVAQAPAQWNYSFVGNNAQALYPGQVSIPQLGTQTCLGTNAGVLSAGACSGSSTVASIAALQALPTANNALVYLTATGRAGWFQFSSANHATDVTNDPQQCVNVAPTSDLTGASGVWIRQLYGAGINQYECGAAGNGSKDDTVAVQAVFNYSLYSGISFKFLPGLDLITSPVIDAASGDMSQAEFLANGKSSNFSTTPSSVLIIGNTTSGLATTNLNVSLPSMRDTSHTAGNDWSGQIATAVGLVNLNYSTITGNNIYGFFTGMRLGGISEGTAYVTVNLGSLVSNHDSLVLQAFNAAGWSNQNTVIGGKITLDSDETSTSGTHGILLLVSATGGNQADGNTFVGTSIEGAIAISAEFSGAIDNTFTGVRFEATTPLIFTTGTDGDYGNFIVGGYKEHLTWSHGGTSEQIGMFDHNGNYVPPPLFLGTAGSTSAPQILTGTGAPSIAAVPGSLYLNLSGGTGTTLYVKESTTGTGGWVAK